MIDFQFPDGATPIHDSSGLIPSWVHNLTDLNRVEAENIINAQRKYLRGPVDEPKNWFQVEELKKIHRAMFGNVWEWAGGYRKSATSIGIKPSLIPARLAELCVEVNAWFEHEVELSFVEMAARIHHRLVFIHPFENGNGRFSRLVADRFLLSWRCSYPVWPNRLNQQSTERKGYIETLKSADRGDYELLIIFMKKLGARDPTLIDLFSNQFYRSLLKGKGGISLVKGLIQNGADLNEISSNDQRPLQLAAKAGLQDIVKFLADYGAE